MIDDDDEWLQPKHNLFLNINYFLLYFPGAGLYYIYNSKKATETKLRSCREANIPPGEGGAWRGS